ncbi:MAG: hypothetical protein CMJ81_10900 [Planctomycetaceae bacterium]|jgi:hypothetical protein|nr:hypothetical protein [Planctomycetaceae bacterium]MBP63070.1 hypothetical protein [Planctomycetaceae bacterium]
MKPVGMSDSAAQTYPRFGLVIWHGLPLAAYGKLLADNGCRVSWNRWDRAFAFGLSGTLNSLLNLADRVAFGQRVENLQLKHDPIFIIGHWRTGTTLLHELLARDGQFGFASTYQCMAPGHFLVSQRFLAPLTRFLLPRRRPMDNMPVDWNRPQEDEFGLCNLGLPSPYLQWMFPRTMPGYDQYLDLAELSDADYRRWKAGMLLLVKRIAYSNPRPLVLKSPPHTARIKTLLELFPHARFIHLVRDPEVMIPSTVHMWKRMSQSMGLQHGCCDQVVDRVFDNFSRMYRSFEQQRDLIPENRLVELRFEDLTCDMLAQVQRIYQCLSLGDFERVRPDMEQFRQEVADYRPNVYQLSAELGARIATTCRSYTQRYGYRARARGC